MQTRIEDKNSKMLTTQHWFYNPKTKALHSEMMPTKVLLEGTNKNLIVFTYKDLATQKFEYDEVN